MDLRPLRDLPSQALGPREGTYFYREWVGALFAALDQPLEIFIDGLDRLSLEAEAFRLLQVMIEETPPSVRIILLSRGYPPFSLDFQSLKMGQRALILSNEDLAFTVPEIREYFKEIHDFSLPKEFLGRVAAATEGWIGGIILLSECLVRVPEAAVADFLSKGLPDRFSRETFQYFGREVFSALTPSRQNFLLTTAILDRLEPEIIRNFFGDDDGQGLLRELVRKNLFVQSYPDPSQGIIFRYHQLFKDFLKALLRSRKSKNELRQLHRRAGNAYAARGEGQTALEHFLEARSFAEAVSLIKKIGPDLVKKARMGDLTRWLEKLPADFIQKEPWLLLFQSLTRRFLFPEENARDLNRAVALFEETSDWSGLLQGLAFLIEVEVTRGKFRLELIDRAEDLLKTHTDEHLAYERALLWSQIGQVHAFRGNPRRGFEACQKAYFLANQVGDLVLQAAALSRGVSCLSRLGEFRAAERLLQDLTPVLWRLDRPEAYAFFSLSHILFLTFRGDHVEALKLGESITAQLEKQGLNYLYPYLLLYRQIALTFSQQYDQADQIGRQLILIADSRKNGFLKGIAQFSLGTSAYWAGRLSEAWDWLDQAMALVAGGESRSDYHLARARLIRGLLPAHTETRLQAIGEIREVLEGAQKDGNHLLKSEAHLALGLKLFEVGQKAEARSHFRNGFQTAQQYDLRHFVDLSPGDTQRACLLALELLEPGPGPLDCAAGLLLRKFGKGAGPELERLSLHPLLEVGIMARELRRKLHRQNSPILHIQTFGGIRVHLGQKEIGETDWDRYQPRRLLAAILSQRSDKIPKEVLIEALWPEERPRTGEHNFKTTLLRLRKTMEAELDPDFGSSYIHLLHNFVFLDEELTRIDCRQFGSLYREGKEKEKKGDMPGLLDCFSRAVDLYQGDFIPEERYAPWVERRREDFRNIYIDLLTCSARYYEESGTYKKAEACLKKTIEADPLLEEAYRSLMSLYDEKQRYTEALRVFEACKKALKAGLNARPDPVTRALAEGIRERANKS